VKMGLSVEDWADDIPAAEASRAIRRATCVRFMGFLLF